MTRVALDLFCGTGGATAAFRNNGWEVFGVDNDERHAPDFCRDLSGWRPSASSFIQRADFIWASPPCTEFSDMPVGSHNRRPSLDLVFAAMEIIRDLRPRFWIIENVRGALPFLGIPRQKIGPFCLWGYFPKIKAPLEVVDYRKMAKQNRNAIERAAIPYALSLAVLEAVERAWDKKTIADLRPYRRHRQVAKMNRTGPAWRPGHELGGQVDGHMADSREMATRPSSDRQLTNNQEAGEIA